MIAHVLRYTEQCMIHHRVPSDHGYNHALAVYNNAVIALETDYTNLSESDKINVLCASILHDVDDRKYFNTINYANAVAILTECGASVSDIKSIVYMISLVSTSHNGGSVAINDSLWNYIPRDSDRVEALGEIGVSRCMQYNVSHNIPLYTLTTPLVYNLTELSVIDTGARFKKYVLTGKSDSVIDHFYDKLLTLDTLSSGSSYLQSLANDRSEYTKLYLFSMCESIREGIIQY